MFSVCGGLPVHIWDGWEGLSPESHLWDAWVASSWIRPCRRAPWGLPHVSLMLMLELMTTSFPFLNIVNMDILKAESIFLPEENVRVHRSRAGRQEGGGLLQVWEGLQQVQHHWHHNFELHFGYDYDFGQCYDHNLKWIDKEVFKIQAIGHFQVALQAEQVLKRGTGDSLAQSPFSSWRSQLTHFWQHRWGTNRSICSSSTSWSRQETPPSSPTMSCESNNDVILSNSHKPYSPVWDTCLLSHIQAKTLPKPKWRTWTFDSTRPNDVNACSTTKSC